MVGLGAAVLAATVPGATAATAGGGTAGGRTTAGRATGGRTTATTPGYVSILFGRTQDGQMAGCKPAAGSVSIPTVLAVLAEHNHGIGTGVVVVNRTAETTDTCRNGTIYPSWATMQQWRAEYGFQVVSEGDYKNLVTLSPSAQYQETCGLLPVFDQHGFTRADGMFAYTDNQFTAAIQSTVVASCFDFGRVYANRVNLQQRMRAPYFAASLSVTGGPCDDPALSCYTAVAGKHYVAPSALARLLSVTGGQWAAVQLYRLVSGAHLTGGITWDCTSADPSQHWTSRHEDYCWNDVQAALAQMSPATVVTDPATVAAAWGRTLGAGARS